MFRITFRYFLKSFILFFLVCFGIAFLGAHDISAQGYRHPQTGITVPDTIGGSLKLWKVTDFEKMSPGAGVGVSYRYDQQLIRADIYFYNNKEPNILDGISEIVQKTWDRVLEVIAAQNFQDLSMIAPRERVLIGSAPFLHTSFTYSQNGTKWVSKRYITGYRNHFIKVFITYVADKKPEGERLTAAVLQTVGSALAK